jgi:parallel beta-helix repeat protein
MDSDKHVTVEFELIPWYQLTVTVVGGHGSVEVDPNGYIYPDGTVVTLTATPEEGYCVKGWYDNGGTLIFMHNNLEIVMDSDKVITVEFRQPNKIGVSGDPNAIADAVNAAENGDTLIVAAGTYNGGINLQGKQLKLFSTNPDDPNIVAQTIIDCNLTGRGFTGFTFDSREDAGTVIGGFTIIGSSVVGQSGSAIYIGTDSSPTIANIIINNCSVSLGDGGAIYIGSGSNSVIANVTVNNCIAVSGDGGGIYVSASSSPRFVNCTVNSCYAFGGSGGAVYCGADSSPIFVGCDFGSSSAYEGGGLYFGLGSTPVLSQCTLAGNNAFFDGGGIYYNAGSVSTLNECTFTSNMADSGGGIFYGSASVSDVSGCTFAGNSAFGDGGGILYNVNSSITIADCNFTGNAANYGGGLYLDPNCSGSITETILVHNNANEDGGAVYISDSNMFVADCNISNNTAVRGAGLHCVDSPETTIIDCTITYNEAARVLITYEYYIPDPNDPNAPPIPGGDPNDPNDPNLIIVMREDRSGIAQGGGIYSFAGPTSIKDSDISYNRASTSGGGLYLAGGEYNTTGLDNCLVTHNSSGRDGAGISNNWQNELAVTNCTIAHNTLTYLVSYGGGLYASYDSNTVVTDSILWGNAGSRGFQVAVCSGDIPYPLPSKVKVTHSDIGLETEDIVDLVNPDAIQVIRPGFNLYSLGSIDDFPSTFATLGFNLNYFGTTYSSLYINNNGNITFDAPMWTFTPFGLTGNIGTPIMAPFFADVDTTLGNVVTYGQGMVDGHNAFAVNWINVGYFFANTDKLNTFQLVLIERSDRAPGDFDIEFNYQTINWESGDLSGGFGGLGGFSARAGFSNGTGNPGTFYEFPGSGIPGSFLDSSSTGLIYGSRGSSVSGRYIFSVRSGALDIVRFLGIPIYVEDGCTLDGWQPTDPNNPLDPSDPNGLLPESNRRRTISRQQLC